MTEEYIERRQGYLQQHSLFKMIALGVISPLVVAIVLGYAAFHTTITRIEVLVQQSDKRLSMAEAELKAMQLLSVKQTEILERLVADYKDLREIFRDAQWRVFGPDGIQGRK